MEFNNLTHNKLLQLRCPENKQASLVIGVYNGKLNFTVMKSSSTGGGFPEIKIIITPKCAEMIKYFWNNILKDPAPGKSVPIDILDNYNKETKTRECSAILIFGYTDELIPYVEVLSDAKGVKYRFVIENELRYGYNKTGLDKMDFVRINIADFCTRITDEATIARRLSEGKPQQYNGNKNNYQQNNNGGGNNNYSGSVEEEFH